ncbi:MAG: hypothetical protein OQK09_01785 [Colwellia sp.]|nr:hypothetical protein [Colwellia sp.]MCW8866580.1 hypothetical protein [Colwellia sp.]MCW9080217.1 hypothetical protein [Colwellia sp.]
MIIFTMECRFMQYHSMENPKQRASTKMQNCYQERDKANFSDMPRVIAVVSYLTLIGWLIATMLYGKHRSHFARFHLRQSLGLIITGALLSFIPLIGWLMNVAVCLVWLFALYHAIQGYQQKVPFLGDFYQEHLDFIK